jgi:hypothetical protein
MISHPLLNGVRVQGWFRIRRSHETKTNDPSNLASSEIDQLEGRNIVENPEAYERAKKRVEAKVGFYIHLAVYVGVNLLLLMINLTRSPQYLWFKWPLLGWGIGLLFHGLSVYLFSGGKFQSIKERMIEEEMKKDSFIKK